MFFCKIDLGFRFQILRGRKMIKSNDDDVLAPLRVELSGPDLGKVLGLTGRRVLQLADEGVLERGPCGGFDLVEATQAYLRFLRDGRGPDISEVVRREVERALKARTS
jgi:hypothetical protein